MSDMKDYPEVRAAFEKVNQAIREYDEVLRRVDMDASEKDFLVDKKLKNGGDIHLCPLSMENYGSICDIEECSRIAVLELQYDHRSLMELWLCKECSENLAESLVKVVGEP